MITSKAQKHLDKVGKPGTRRSLGSADFDDPSERSPARHTGEIELHDEARPEEVSPVDTRGDTAGAAVGRHRLLGGLLLVPAAVLFIAPFFIASSYFADFQLFGTIMSVAAGAILGLWALSHFRRASTLEDALMVEAEAVTGQTSDKPAVLHSGERVYH